MKRSNSNYIFKMKLNDTFVNEDVILKLGKKALSLFSKRF